MNRIRPHIFQIFRGFFSMASILLISCSKEAPVPVETAIETAGKLLDEGKKEQGIASLKKLHTEHPGNQKILELLAFALAQNKQPAEAAHYFSLLGNNGPDKAHYFRYAAKNLEQVEKYEEAITYYKKYLANAPKDSAPWKSIAELYNEKLNSPKDAIQAYLKSYELKPRTKVARQLAKLYHNVNNKAQAESWYREAMKTEDPSNSEAYLGLLKLALGKKNFEEAEQLISELDKKFPGALDVSGLAKHRDELQSWREAQEKLVKSLQSLSTGASENTTLEVTPATPDNTNATTEVTKVANADSGITPSTSEADTNQSSPENEINPEPAEKLQIATETIASSTDKVENSNEPTIVEVQTIEIPEVPNAEEEIDTAPPEIISRFDSSTTESTQQLPSLPNPTLLEEEDWSTRMANAISDRENKNYESALEKLWEIINEDDSHHNVWYELSQTYWEQNILPRAEVTCQEAVRRDSTNLKYTLHYLKIVQKSRTPKRFFEEVVHAKNMFPASQELTLILARTYASYKNNKRNAAILYQEFLKNAPNHPQYEAAKQELQQLFHNQ